MSKTNRKTGVDERWYVIEHGGDVPFREVFPVKVSGDWLHITRNHRVRIGSIAVQGKKNAFRLAWEIAQGAVRDAQRELRKAEKYLMDIESFDEATR